ASAKLRDHLIALDPLPPTEPLPLRAMGLLVWLCKNFVDPYHHRKEEEVLIPFAEMRGLAPEDCAFVAIEHAQGRNYFEGMAIALKRIRAGNRKAVGDFKYNLSGFIELYKDHGPHEDNILFKILGDKLSPVDDALICDLISRIGPPDITLYIQVIAE